MFRPIRFCLPLSLCFALVACSPALNWRELHGQSLGLSALLPCKPDRAQKPVPLGGQLTELLMWGCEADGALFALSAADLGDAARVPAVLSQWQGLMLSHMRAAQPVQGPWRVAGADIAASRVQASGTHPDGRAVQAQAVFFARGSRVYQAAIYAPRVSAQAAETFFSSLKLQ